MPPSRGHTGIRIVREDIQRMGGRGKEIASALIGFGRGSTYTDTARRVHAQANYGKTAKCREVVNGQMVAE